MGNYDDIIDHPHHVSRRRPQMPMSERAAQFSPFAALTGYGDVIREANRFVDDRLILDEETLKILDRKFQTLMEHLSDRPTVVFTYFVPDQSKDGGAYIDAEGIVKKIDIFSRFITLENGTQISMNNIFDMESEIFADMQ